MPRVSAWGLIGSRSVRLKPDLRFFVLVAGAENRVMGPKCLPFFMTFCDICDRS